MGLNLSSQEIQVAVTVLITAGFLSLLGVTPAQNFLKKLYVNIFGVVNFVTANARGAKKKHVKKFLATYKNPIPEGASKKIYFVRHGQSEWNYMANRGIKGFGWVPIYLIKEIFSYFSADSYFYDSPLSERGRIQGQTIYEKLENPQTDELMTLKDISTKNTTLICSSNLRRAISTTLYGFKDIFTTKGLVINGLMQEMTRNVDGISLAPGRQSIPPCPSIEEKSLGALYQTLDVKNYEGRPGLVQFKSDGVKRIYDFAQWLFTQNESHIICGGHSIYFRTFFQFFVDDEHHEACNSKISNGGVVSFDFTVEDGKFVVSNIQEVHKGFDKKKK